jgi:hypothetical protein
MEFLLEGYERMWSTRQTVTVHACRSSMFIIAVDRTPRPPHAHMTCFLIIDRYLFSADGFLRREPRSIVKHAIGNAGRVRSSVSNEVPQLPATF